MNEDLRDSDDGVLDRAIDRAVRTMMRVEPPPGLRRRVLARLEARPDTTLFPRLAVGLAAVALLVLAVAVLFEPAQGPVTRPAERSAATRPSPGAAPADQPAPRAPAAETPRATAPPRRTRPTTDTPLPMPRIASVFGARDARVAATAAVVDDVVFPAESAGGEPTADRPGLPPAIGIPAIRIAPLEIGPIRVEPMPTRK